jgi:beta-lactamase class A
MAGAAEAERTRMEWRTSFQVLSHALAEKLAKAGFDYRVSDQGPKEGYVARARIYGKVAGRGYDVAINVKPDGTIVPSKSGRDYGMSHDVADTGPADISIFAAKADQYEKILLNLLDIE